MAMEERIFRKGLPRNKSQDRIARRGRTDRKGQPGKDCEDSLHDSQDRTARTGQPE
jgi:hypothetical protein